MCGFVGVDKDLFLSPIVVLGLSFYHLSVLCAKTGCGAIDSYFLLHKLAKCLFL